MSSLFYLSRHGQCAVQDSKRFPLAQLNLGVSGQKTLDCTKVKTESSCERKPLPRPAVQPLASSRTYNSSAHSLGLDLDPIRRRWLQRHTSSVSAQHASELTELELGMDDPIHHLRRTMSSNTVSEREPPSYTTMARSSSRHDKPYLPPRQRMNKTGFKRSRKGCLVCRGQKKKCDEAKPVCTRCKNNNHLCRYPSDDSLNRICTPFKNDPIPTLFDSPSPNHSIGRFDPRSIQEAMFVTMQNNYSNLTNKFASNPSNTAAAAVVATSEKDEVVDSNLTSMRAYSIGSSPLQVKPLDGPSATPPVSTTKAPLITSRRLPLPVKRSLSESRARLAITSPTASSSLDLAVTTITKGLELPDIVLPPRSPSLHGNVDGKCDRNGNSGNGCRLPPISSLLNPNSDGIVPMFTKRLSAPELI